MSVLCSSFPDVAQSNEGEYPFLWLQLLVLIQVEVSGVNALVGEKTIASTEMRYFTVALMFLWCDAAAFLYAI